VAAFHYPKQQTARQKIILELNVQLTITLYPHKQSKNIEMGCATAMHQTGWDVIPNHKEYIKQLTAIHMFLFQIEEKQGSRARRRPTKGGGAR